LWGLVAIAAGQWQAGAAALGIRILAGVVVAGPILRYRGIQADFWMIPLRDLFGFAVWLCGLFGDEVLWRGQRLRLAPDGRIRVKPPSPAHCANSH
jgi:ceramide glucosyltransferase